MIARCLRTLLADSTDDEWEVVVVANGCADRTAEIARTVAPHATVIELDEASKIAALNLGDRASTVYPRAYLDADVEISSASLRAVVRSLEVDGVECAAPRMTLVVGDRPWFVRAFYRAFGRLPYLGDGLVGHGIYVVSEEGRRRFDSFPDITADDLFIRNLFAEEERSSVEGATFVVHPPRTLSGLLAIRQRAYRGNEEYHRRGFTSRAAPTLDPGRNVRALLRHPFDTTVFVAINTIARLQLRLRRSTTTVWERDESGRS